MTLSVLKSPLFIKLFRLERISSLLLVLGLLVPTLWAAVGGNITGTVTDPKGLLIGGAKVSAIQLGTNLKQTTITDAKGVYPLPGLPVGLYEIDIDAVGFKQYRETNLNLNASGALLVNASLLFGG